MEVVCISASNIKHAGVNSTSLKVCHLIKDMVEEKLCKDLNVRVVSLVDYELKPCIGCGGCFCKEACVCDEAFNHIFNMLIKADALFIVSAHYAPIPSKLAALLEKMEQLAFLKRFNDEGYRSPLFNKSVGIIAHGGGPEEIIKYYKEPVLDSIWNALSYPIEMDVVKLNGDNGVVIPVKRVLKSEDSIFPVQEYDWEDVRRRIEPLVNKLFSIG